MPMTREEFAFSIKQKFPQYREMDNDELVTRVVGRYPQYRQQIVDLDGPVTTKVGGVTFTTGSQEKPGFEPGRAARDFLGGLGGRAAETFTNLGELGTRIKNALTAEIDTAKDPGGLGAMTSAFQGDDAEKQAELAPFAEAKEEIKEETPTSTAAQLGGLAESIGEFTAGGAARTGVEKTLLSPLAQRVLQEAITGGTVGSLREGKLFDPAAVVTSGIGGGVGHGLAKLGGKAIEHAPKAIGSLLGKGGSQGREKAVRAIEEWISSGRIPKGANLKELAASAGKEKALAHEAMATFRQTAPKDINLDDVIREVSSLSEELVPGVPLDKAAARQLETLLEPLREAQARGATVPAESLEKLLRRWSKSYAQSSEPAVADVTRSASDRLRAAMNTAQPGREPLGQRISEASQLAKRFRAKAEGAALEGGGSPGSVIALSALAGGGLGAAAGGKEGAATGVAVGLSPFVALKLLRSPAWRSLSAPAQQRIGKMLQGMSNEKALRVVNALIQGGAQDSKKE